MTLDRSVLSVAMCYARRKYQNLTGEVAMDGDLTARKSFNWESCPVVGAISVQYFVSNAVMTWTAS